MNGPTEKKNRIEQLDIIRGFALFGVLLVNLTMIDATMFSYSSSPFEFVSSLDRFFSLLIHIFAVGKFYTLFSMLFGLGFYYFINKSDGSSLSSRLFLRRLVILFGFGLLHVTFVWYGDILHVYALTGIFLLLNRNKSEAQLLRSAVLLFLFSTALFVLIQSGNASDSGINPAIREAFNAYTQKSYSGMLFYRIQNELPNVFFNLVFIMPKILSLFLMGYYVGKKKILSNLDENREQIKTVLKISLLISIVCSAGYVLAEMGVFAGRSQALSVLFEEVLTLSGALFYATGLICLSKSKRGKVLVSPLKYTGQMALTNYLIQTLFFTTLIYGYGFGLFGKIPYWGYLPIAVTFYFAQGLFSKWWLSRFNFGPMEKVWRTLTYWQSR